MILTFLEFIIFARGAHYDDSPRASKYLATPLPKTQIPSSPIMKEIFNLRFCNRDLYRKFKASGNTVPEAAVTRCLRLPMTVLAKECANVGRSVGG
jgi:hypothetical protein